MVPNDKLRILIVEDRLLTVEQLGEIVKSGVSRLTIAITASEEAAINHLQTIAPDLVILDLSLKKGSAITVLRAVRDLRPASTVAAIANGGLPHLRELAVKMGADYVLDSVTDSEALSAIVRAVAQQRKIKPDSDLEGSAPIALDGVPDAPGSSTKRLH